MSAPRTKRPFAGAAADPSQRHITAFFSAADSPSSPSAVEPPRRQPSIPPSVQANLLSVGMRVRKSVPEGYKTLDTSAFKLWTDSSVPPVPAVARELLPFCAINNVGGLGTQPDLCVNDGQGEDAAPAPALDALPGLSLSQESVESNTSDASRKRSFDDADATADVPTTWLHPGSKAWDDQVSPRSFAPVNWGNARPMATPRSRVRKSLALKEMGQENMVVEGDFEEADFLVINDGREMDTSF